MEAIRPELKARDGFTLVEVVVSLMLLSVVTLMIGTATARLGSLGVRNARLLSALDLVAERVARIESDPAYAQLEARYAGTESSIALFDGFERTTTIEQFEQTLPNGRELEYKVVDVTVMGAGLAEPLSRRVIVAGP